MGNQVLNLIISGMPSIQESRILLEQLNKEF